MVHFERPPLVEVVFGLAFKPLDGFTAGHIGAYWQRIRPDYPRCEHVAPLGHVPPASDSWPVPLPRTWFKSSDGTRMTQLQNGRFLVNWCKQEDRPEYPSYRALFPEFVKCVAGFQTFLAEQALGELHVTEFELSYIDHIYWGDLAHSAAEVGKIMRGVCWQGAGGIPEPESICWQTIFPLPEHAGRLHVDLKQGTRKTNGMPLYLVEMSAKGRGADGLAAMPAWFDIAHQAISTTFVALTTPEAQTQLWGRKDSEA